MARDVMKSMHLPTGIGIAILAALAVSLLLVGLVRAQATADTYQYAENGMDPVVTFTADDPEGVSPTVWTVLQSDEGDQDIGGDGPENADDVAAADVADAEHFAINSDGELSFTNPPNFEVPSGEGETISNTYKVVVQASDGGATSWVNWFKVTVIVTDLEEPGSVSWMVDPDDGGPEGPQNLRQFQAGAVLAATVADPDGEVTDETWKWYRSLTQSGPWAEIFEEVAATYTASDKAENNDVGMYLRAVATYTDRRGGSKLAERVSLYPVQEAKEINTPPKFPSEVASRSVDEELSGANVGGPVRGRDADGDVLNYTLGDGDDAGSFDIDRATGQITTAAALDYENPDDTNDDNEYEVTVTVTDSSGAESVPVITVTITVKNVNEDPNFDADTPAGMVADHLEDNDPLTIGTFTATDPEGGEVTLSLSEGADSGLFEFIELSPTPAANSKMVAFKEKPDFENPGDSNGDNIYQVTVQASDTVNTTRRSVTVKVTDADEDGKVNLSTQAAVVGSPITATLTDSDGEIARETWQWESVTPEGGCAGLPIDATWVGIDGAKSATYTPASDDKGNCLRALARYMDRTTTEDDTTDPTDNDPGDDPDNRDPVYKHGDVRVDDGGPARPGKPNPDVQ